MKKNRAVKSGSGTETPLMQQYARIKAQFPDAVLLFRVGDFYETFDADARVASRVLGLTLTKRNNGAAASMDLAGFPHHSIESYLPRLVRAGHRVAICDQLEDPKLAKTIVKRGVTEVVTPGVAFNDRVVDQRSNNWLAAVVAGKHPKSKNLPWYGAAFLDATTGEFLVGEGDAASIGKFMVAYSPSELLFPKQHGDVQLGAWTTSFHSFGLDDWAFTHDFARERLLHQFGTASLKGFGIEELALAQCAAGAVLHYLAETKHDKLAHLSSVGRLGEDGHLWLDRFTVQNLELVQPAHEGGHSLFAAMDRCLTPMGARMLRRWLLFPSLDEEVVSKRLDGVGELLANSTLTEALAEELRSVGDIERTVGRAAVGRIHPREMLHLQRAMEAVGRSAAKLHGTKALEHLAGRMEVPTGLIERIGTTIEPNAPTNLMRGGAVRGGVHTELDELRHVATHAKELLLEVQTRESRATGIASLKVGFNNVFGYYLEVRNTHKDKVPREWTRKQTLTGAERYVTEELKQLEERILGAEERSLVLEQEVFNGLVEAVCGEMPGLRRLCAAVSELDVLLAFAMNARAWNYCRPAFTSGRAISIAQGRHAVIEQQLPPGETYVPNDMHLDGEDRQVLMITGPNMSGKSALLRQTALISIMAQVGSYVPAKSATLGLVDRVFTRVGASDNLSTGESTFMVEMNETASILNNLSERSLVLLDEIGRGTSTYDGISIAWAVAEHLHQHAGRPITLFATHYHELNEMAAVFPRIKNAHVAVREAGEKVLFLRKLLPGGTDRSFGLHVARMAGMPRSVVDRAGSVLKHLEKSHAGNLGEEPGAEAPERNSLKADLSGIGNDLQLSIFQLDDPALERIREEIAALDIDTLTPVEALLKLNEIKRLVVPKAKLRKA
ncbi:MAG: DNA mismatch repair protein MutS [Flavobacteriales bacterium]|nr:MAG: DNA mismatch repair protein MutS [Flavobacteriales bacterium]